LLTILKGAVEVTFRGETLTARAGETIDVPANAPHGFRIVGDSPSRLLCLCAPAGATVPHPDMQAILDTALGSADDGGLQWFEVLSRSAATGAAAHAVRADVEYESWTDATGALQQSGPARPRRAWSSWLLRFPKTAGGGVMFWHDALRGGTGTGRGTVAATVGVVADGEPDEAAD
jgi:hypothetical protein